MLLRYNGINTNAPRTLAKEPSPLSALSYRCSDVQNNKRAHALLYIGTFQRRGQNPRDPSEVIGAALPVVVLANFCSIRAGTKIQTPFVGLPSIIQSHSKMVGFADVISSARGSSALPYATEALKDRITCFSDVMSRPALQVSLFL